MSLNGTAASDFDRAATIGFVDLSAMQWMTVTKLAHLHADIDRHRRTGVALEQDQGKGLNVRMTLHHEGAENAHVGYLIDSGGGYRTVEP